MVFFSLLTATFVRGQNANDPFYRYGFPHEQIYVDIELALSNAKEVSKLKIEDTDLSLMVDKLRKIKNVQVLKLANNHLDSLPEELFKNGKLLYFESLGNPLKKLPANFGQNIGLKEFKLIGAKLDSLPNSFSSLSRLSRIEMQSVESDSLLLNNALSKLTQLSEVLFYKVPLTQFPITSSSKLQLHQVYLVDCNLSQIDSLFWENSKVEVLVLDNNQISEIPKEVVNLEALVTLSLKNNKIEHLPEYFSRLKTLKTLDISGNKIPRHEMEIIRILLPNCKIIY